MISSDEYLHFSQEAVVEDVTYSMATVPKLKVRLEREGDYEDFAGVTKRRGRKAGQVLVLMVRHDVDSDFVKLDAWFAGWTVSHTKGCVITVTLDEEGFELARKHLRAGETCELVVYEIEEDGTSHNEQLRKKVEAQLKGGPLSIQAAKACREIGFHRYLEETLKTDPINHATEAAQIVRQHCGIQSRSLLDHDRQAAQIWKALYRPYLMEGM